MFESADPRTIPLVADRLCLNMVNTVDSFDREQPKEYLRSYGDLITWGERVALLDGPQAAGLLAEAERWPARAALALEGVRKLRFALYGIFAALSAREAVPIDALDTLNGVLAQAPARRRLVTAGEGFVWAHEGAPTLDLIVWEVGWSAADLLASRDAAYVRVCAGAGCSWTFLDTSRGRTRRWCSMEWCGNRAKARRYYQRIR